MRQQQALGPRSSTLSGLMPRPPTATAQARERATLGPMTKLTTYKTLWRLLTIPDSALETTNSQKIRQALLQDYSVPIAKRREIGGHSSLHCQNLGTEKVIEIVTSDFICEIMQVHDSELFRISGHRNILVIKANAFCRMVVTNRLLTEGNTYFPIVQELNTAEVFTFENLQQLWEYLRRPSLLVDTSKKM